MTSLAQARQAVATALSGVSGLTVQPSPTVRSHRAGDGWVTAGRMTPADFSRCMVQLSAVVLLSPDEVKAEALLDELAVSMIDAVTSATIPTSDVALEPTSLLVGNDSSPMYGAVLTLSTEVE